MSRLRTLRRDWTLWCFPLAYAIAAWRIYGNLGLLDNTHLIGGLWSDPIQQTWFLEYWKWALINGHFAAWTNAMDFPLGFNLFGNPSLPLLAIPAIPLTALFGPVATLGLLFRLGFWISALVVFVLLRRLLDSRVAAGLGGFMYAFGPSQAAWGQNWLHFTFVPLPATMLYLIYRGVTEPETARRRGLLLAMATTGEVLIDPEFAVETLLMAGLVLTITSIGRAARRCLTRDDLDAFVRAGVGFATVGTLPLALLSWLILFGRGSYHGALFSLHSSAYTPVDVLLPAATNVLTSQFGIVVPHYTVAALNGTYIGVPLILACAVTVFHLRRQPLVRAAGMMTVIAWIFTLGNYLSSPDGTVTSIPLPFSVINQLPVGGSIDGSRYTLLLDLGVTVLLAAGINAAIQSRRRAAVRVPFAALIAFGVVLAAPTSALSTGSLTPFATAEAASPAIQHVIPSGGVVLTLPYSNGGPIESMLWQAMAGMRFKMLGGYAMRQSKPGYPAYGYPELAASTVNCLLMAGPAKARGPVCQSVPAARSRLRAFVRRWNVSAILVQVQPGDGDMLSLLDGMYKATAHDGSMYVWATGTKLGSRVSARHLGQPG